MLSLRAAEVPSVNDSGFPSFGPFLIIRELGRGGMGEVFLARTPWPVHPLAAVKRLRPDVARIPTFEERFRHEAALAVRLQHPNLVSTIDVGSVGEQIYVASEMVLGKDTGIIADRLRSRSQGGPVAVAIRLAIEGLAGLGYVHGATEVDGTPLGLVHRDVTPGNLLLGYDGRARLADFGLAKSQLSESSKLTKHGEILGTPHYLAPEVVKGHRATAASDIYGLGAVIYRFLTGVAPFQGSAREVLMKVLSERPRPLPELRPDLPAWLVELLALMLEPEAGRRARDANALAERVAKRARTEGMLVPPQAVGRWLAQLFAEEHVRELEEHARLIELDAALLGPPKEGTVVLARSVGSEGSESRLAGPSPVHTGDDEVGTQLELSASELQAHAREVGLGHSGRVEHAEAEEGPTRAVPAYADPADEGDPDETDIEPRAEARSRLGLSETLDEADEALPGFAGSGDALASGEPAVDTVPPPPEPKSEASDPMLLVTPVEDGSPQLPLPRGLTPASPPRYPSARRSLLLLAGLLFLAVAAGVGLGRGIARMRSGPGMQVEAIEPAGEASKARLEALSRRLEILEARGESVPPEAWRHLSRAARALLENEPARAAAHLDALELLVSPR